MYYQGVIESDVILSKRIIGGNKVILVFTFNKPCDKYSNFRNEWSDRI